MGKSMTLIDGHSAADAITGAYHNASGASRGIERQHGPDGHVQGWGVEGLKHHLGHLLAVGLRVEGGLGEEDWVVL